MRRLDYISNFQNFFFKLPNFKWHLTLNLKTKSKHIHKNSLCCIWNDSTRAELKGIKLISYLASEGFRSTHKYGTMWYVGNPGHFNKVMTLLWKKINPDDGESWKFLPFCFQTQHSLWKQQYLFTASFSNSMHVDWRQKGFDDIDVKEF